MERALAQNVSDIVRHAIGYREPARALILFDRRSALARLLEAAYRAALPAARFLHFDEATHEEILAVIAALSPRDLVVLVQSTRFDLREFRFRLELFKRGLAVVEHPHLARIYDAELAYYVDSLAYDPAYYRGLGRALKSRIDGASTIHLRSPGAVLTYDGPFEDAKLNVGDYSAMANIGGQFPIGEVFTEPVEVRGCNGEVRLCCYGDEEFAANFAPEPFLVCIRDGQVVDAPGAPERFLRVLDSIRALEETVWVRELGFGLNPAFSPARRVTDVGTYERNAGLHLSLGAKHPVYPKAGFNKRTARFHVDVFVEQAEVDIDGERVFADQRYLV